MVWKFGWTPFLRKRWGFVFCTGGALKTHILLQTLRILEVCNENEAKYPLKPDKILHQIKRSKGRKNAMVNVNAYMRNANPSGVRKLIKIIC